MTKNKKMLIADDMEINRVILRALFAGEYEILEAADGEQAMSVLKKHGDEIALLLLDIVMPNKDGYEVLSNMHALGLLRKIPVIVITIMADAENEVKAFELGASDIVTKPFEPRVIKRRVQNVMDSHLHKLRMENMITSQKKLIGASYKSTVDMLRTMIESRNIEDNHHILRVKRYTELLLSEAASAYPEMRITAEDIGMASVAAMLHDIGKKTIPGKLTDNGILDMLADSQSKSFIEHARNICNYKYGRTDTENITKDAKLLAEACAVGIADAYDTITSQQQYDPRYTHDYAVKMILDGVCGSFSPELLKCFNTLQDKFKELDEQYPEDASIDDNELILEDIAGELICNASENRDEIDPYKYYALMQYIDAGIFELDLTEKKYRQLSPSKIEFLNIKQNGITENGLILPLLEYAEPSEKHRLREWLSTAVLRAETRKTTNTGTSFRLFNVPYQEYQTYQLTIMSVEDSLDICDKALFIIKNVHRQTELQGGLNDGGIRRYVEENERLKVKAELDQLTELYNKMTVQKVIADIMEAKPSGAYGLMIIDIDNFKAINDTAGHIAGDRALREIAQLLKKNFRGSDVLGRIGGDEFIVLINGLPNKELMEMKAVRLISELEETSTRLLIQAEMSISIGGAVYPEQACTFLELYDKADKALYMAKNFGRKQYRIYSTLTELEMAQKPRKRKENLIEGTVSMDTSFNKLLPFRAIQVDDVEEKINLLMDITARFYGLSHIAVIDTRGKKKLYLWSAAESQMLSQATVESLSDLLAEIDGGIYEIPDVPQSDFPQKDELLRNEILACMSCGTPQRPDKKSTAVMFTFGNTHIWNDNEKEACTIMTKLLHEIIENKAVQAEIAREKLFNSLIFRNMDGIGYIVDEAYILLNMNEATKRRATHQGDKCYSRLFGLKTPCDECPLKKMSRSCHEASAIMPYPESGMTKIHALSFEWGEKENAYIIMSDATHNA